MPVTVSVNFLSVVHKDSGGVTIAAPDVCKTPSPGGPIPIPYPNVAKSSDGDKGAKKVTADGNPILHEGSSFAMSSGDEAGSAGGGVVSGKIKGKAEFVNFSFDVQVEGKHVVRALDPMLHNDKNTPPAPLVQGPAVALPPSGKIKNVCTICKEEF